MALVAVTAQWQLLVGSFTANNLPTGSFFSSLPPVIERTHILSSIDLPASVRYCFLFIYPFARVMRTQPTHQHPLQGWLDYKHYYIVRSSMYNNEH